MKTTTNRGKNGDKHIFRGSNQNLETNWRQRTYYKKSFSIGPLSQSLTDLSPVSFDADCLLVLKVVTSLLIWFLHKSLYLYGLIPCDCLPSASPYKSLSDQKASSYKSLSDQKASTYKCLSQISISKKIANLAKFDPVQDQDELAKFFRSPTLTSNIFAIPWPKKMFSTYLIWKI